MPCEIVWCVVVERERGVAWVLLTSVVLCVWRRELSLKLGRERARRSVKKPIAVCEVDCAVRVLSKVLAAPNS